MGLPEVGPQRPTWVAFAGAPSVGAGVDTHGCTKYDIILDNMGNRPSTACRRILSSSGRYVLVSGPKDRRVLGPIGHMARAVAAFAFRSQTAKPFIADATAERLDTLRERLERLHVQPVIDRTYPLAEVADALTYLAEGHVRGKVVIAVGS